MIRVRNDIKVDTHGYRGVGLDQKISKIKACCVKLDDPINDYKIFVVVFPS